MQILNFSTKEKTLKSYRGEQQCKKIILGINLDLNKGIQERMENKNDPIVTEHIEIFKIPETVINCHIFIRNNNIWR